MAIISKSSLFSLLFIGLFFAPYLAGTRLRLDVVLCYAGAILMPISMLRRGSISKREGVLLLLSFICLMATTIFALKAPIGGFERINILTNYNFVAFSLLVFLAMRDSLVTSRYKLLAATFSASILVNAIALYQWADASSAFNREIYRLYGGAPTAYAASLGYSSFSEFLVFAAKRYPSVFNGMHVLAIFDLMVLAAVGHVISHKADPIAKWLAATAAVGAMVGGILSFSKTFVFGLVLLVVLQQALTRRLRYVTFPVLLVGAILAIGDLTGSEERLLSIFESDALSTRYGEGGYLEGAVRDLVSSAEFFLLGVGDQLGFYSLADSLYVPPMLIGGVLYLTLYLAPIATLLMWNYSEHRKGNSWATTFLVVHLLFLVIGIGIPTYQVGRIAPLFLITNLAFLYAPKRAQFALLPSGLR